jgi:general secretion pathway protein G
MLGRRRTGFTLIDLMIVIIILGVLAAIVLPLISHHLDAAQQTAAEATLSAVEKSLELYWLENNAYPTSLDALTFQTNRPLKLPDGYSLTYDPMTGAVALATP